MSYYVIEAAMVPQYSAALRSLNRLLPVELLPTFIPISTEKLADLHGLKDYDTALPQEFVDDVKIRTGKDPVSHFVWCYDMSHEGLPVSLTMEGRIIDEIYRHIKNSEGSEK